MAAGSDAAYLRLQPGFVGCCMTATCLTRGGNEKLFQQHKFTQFSVQWADQCHKGDFDLNPDVYGFKLWHSILFERNNKTTLYFYLPYKACSWNCVMTKQLQPFFFFFYKHMTCCAVNCAFRLSNSRLEEVATRWMLDVRAAQCTCTHKPSFNPNTDYRLKSSTNLLAVATLTSDWKPIISGIGTLLYRVRNIVRPRAACSLFAGPGSFLVRWKKKNVLNRVKLLVRFKFCIKFCCFLSGPLRLTWSY